MKLLRVSPITKGISRDLFYFSSKDIKPGAIVSIPIRKKEAIAAVISVKNARDLKSELRHSKYALKKISKVLEPNSFFNEEFLKATQKIAKYYLTGTGAIINELCPKAILEKPPKIETYLPVSKDGLQSLEKQVDPLEQKQTIVLQEKKEERIKYYKNLIRSEFAKNQSIFICLPSMGEVERFEQDLQKGIEKFTFSFHSKMGKKDLREKWKKVTEEKHPVLIISTGLFLSINRPDIKTFILENEGSPFYKLRNRPFLKIKKIIKILAAQTNSSLILAGQVVSTETYTKKEIGKFSSAIPTQPKVISTAKQILVEMKKNKGPISNELKEMLEAAYKNNERSILFINRRGYQPSTICNDCGRILKCPHCDSPLVLHKDSKRKFICHKCVSQIKAGNNCPYCKGYNLKTLGYGIQKISEEISRLFPDFKILRLDSDAAKTKKQAQEIIKEFRENTGSVLITTELLFSYLEEEVERIGVLSIDNLFNLPDFRINERVFRTLLKLKTKTTKTFLIQSRLTEHPIFKNVLDGDIKGFYESEMEFRKALGYPPFKTLIKIIREGKNKEQIEKEVEILEKSLAPYNPASFCPFTPRIKNLYRSYILLKLKPGWPAKHKELHQTLASLPPQWKIDIDPESLL